MSTHREVMVKMVLDQWHSRIKAANTLIEKLTDEQFQLEVAPGKNRALYLIGHLTGAHDSMIHVLGFGETLYPQLLEMFLKTPDKALIALPSAAELRTYWKNVSTTLDKHMLELSVEDWFSKHASVSEEDFVKEPHRNKLNLVLSRTGHLAYHLGQLALLDKKEVPA